MGLIKKVGTRGLASSSSREQTTQPAEASDSLPTDPAQGGDTRINLGQPQPAPVDQSSRDESEAPMHMLSPGSTLQERYQIIAPLGVGGMSVVYRGRDLRFKDVARYCAIKEMSQSASDSHTRLLNLKNFQREAGLLATLQHPAIPKVYDFFEEHHRVYLVLELVDGKDLEAVLDEARGPLDELRVARWAIQICDVLHYIHHHQPEAIVFRDMKPSNVMVDSNERIVLIDFGIARNLNRSDRKGTMIGTEGYSPPEQYRGLAEPVGDLYALGATLHHLLTASDPRLETPFTFQDRPMRQINPKLSPDIERIVVKALEYEMAARWQSAEEMKQALMAIPGVVAGERVAVPTMPAVIKTAAQTELVWKFTCEDELRSSPCVSAGTVFIGCYDTNMYAVDARRGEFRWKYATEGGINSSPAVWEDNVIIGSEDGAVYCLDVRRGALRWTCRTDKPVRSSPRVEDRVIFVGSDDQHIYAIDGLRGSIIWKYRTWNPIRSSACIQDDVIFIGGDDGCVYALDARSGAVRWKQRTQQPVRSSPVFAEGLVIVGSLDQNIYGLDAAGGWPAWRFRTGHYVNSSPYVAGTRVFVGGVDGMLYALDVKTGRVAWKFEVGNQITSSPRVANGRVYVGGVDGYVYCVDTNNGALIWKYKTEAAVVSSPFIHDGVVYIGSLDYNLYALKA
ncbi:PQQ-binding-like beta-propeller repeat protein [Candidatus Chloroploca sp. Khr17]|uniref:serine/threonine-protein kinase n=1 Tax=Candidatus Chloroploca sp. Khr17 TaxID=2496869 RepID=UPI00101D9631|nr:serine/threonine-protein kinase [Candidatus Chloroploca sp. Khr17]